MRTAFVRALTEAAKKNKRIILLTGDLGFSVFEEFQQKCPHQYFNCGVAEQSMTGIAAGLALEGNIPVIYSIVPFVTMRNFEQIRNDICYQYANVKIVGIGAGFSYGPYGHTHHAVEDIGILRTLPTMTILCPGDPIEVDVATKAMLEHKGPVYLRIGKAGEPNVHKKAPKFSIGKGIVIQDGNDITILATSTMLYRGWEVMQELQKNNISVKFVSMPTIKPFDQDLVRTCIKETKKIFSLEEHSVIGGLGSAVAEVIAEYGQPVIFKRIGVPDRFTKVIGKQEYMRRANGLTANQIVKNIQQEIKKDL